MKRISKFLAFLLVFSIVLPGLAQAAPVAGSVNITRIGGENRSITSILASNKAYKTADNVVLAGYRGSADALSATAFAVSKEAPMLITAGQQKLSNEIRSEIKRLATKKVYIIGGTTVVPAAIENELKAMKVTVERLQGRDRFQTAARMAQVSSQKSRVFLTIGRNMLSDGTDDSLADALAIGPVSAKQQMPILLTQTNQIPAATKAALKSLGVKEVTVIGGELAVAPKVAAELKAMNISVTRDAGKNRYETAVVIADKYFKDAKNIIVANGRKDADALVGGYLGVKWTAPVLLTAHNKLAPETQAYMESHKLNTYVLGGKVVVHDSVLDEMQIALSKVLKESQEFFNKEIGKITEITSGTQKVASISYSPTTRTATVTLLDPDYLEVTGTGIFKMLADLGVKEVSFPGSNNWIKVTPNNAEAILDAAEIVAGQNSFTTTFTTRIQPEGKAMFTQEFTVNFVVK